VSRKKKRYNDALEGLSKADQDLDAAIAGVVIWASKLGDAANRRRRYLKRLAEEAEGPGRPPSTFTPIAGRAALELVDRVKAGARELLDRAGYEVPPEGGEPRKKP
jgi:hypothetical protein